MENSMANYRRKPVKLRSVQWTGNNYEELKEFVGEYLTNKDMDLYVETSRGKLHVSKGDYVVKDKCGNFYPCKPEIMEQLYEGVV